MDYEDDGEWDVAARATTAGGLEMQALHAVCPLPISKRQTDCQSARSLPFGLCRRSVPRKLTRHNKWDSRSSRLLE